MMCNSNISNVTDFQYGGSDFRKQCSKDFYNRIDEKVTSASLWRINGLDSIKKIKV
jgi:hypothetical protein